MWQELGALTKNPLSQYKWFCACVSKAKTKKRFNKKDLISLLRIRRKNDLHVDGRPVYNISYIMKLSKEILPTFFLIFSV
jgi:hypothetical protein